MKTIKGKFHYQVKDLIRDLKEFPQDSIIFAIWCGKNENFHEKPIYKVTETADPGEVYLYLGDDKQKDTCSCKMHDRVYYGCRCGGDK